MAESFYAWGREDPTRLALVDALGNQKTFGEMLARVNQISNALQSLGLHRGSAVAMLLANRSEWLEFTLAGLQSGLYVTPINFHLTAAEVAYILENSEAEAFLSDERFAETATAARDQAGIAADKAFALGTIAGFRDFTSWVDSFSSSEPSELSAGSAMLYTSGTTGRPKGVRRALPEGSPEESAAAAGLLALLFNMEAGKGVHLAAGPLYHAAPGAFAQAALHLGHTVVLMDKWTPEGTMERIQEYQVTNTHFVPTMFHRLLKLPEEQRLSYDVSSLQQVVHAAAPTPPETKHKMMEWFGPVLYEYYAGTEGGGTFVGPGEWLEHPGTVGRPFPMAEVKILDDQGQEVAAGEVGEVYMGLPNIGGLAGFEYYKDSEKTQKSYRGGLFTLGDAGYVDEEGYLFLTDRKSDMIISGGVNIYPAEIEAVLVQHPAVRDVAVFGIPDDDWGEQIKAVIELSEGYAAEAALVDELLKFAEIQLARYKLPKSVDFSPELPRTLAGKLYKRRLRDPYWEGRNRRI